MAREALAVAVLLCSALLFAPSASSARVNADRWNSNNDASVHAPVLSARPEGIHDRFARMKVLDAEARIFMFENFYTDEECDHIIKLSETHMERSGVVAQKGNSEISDIRTSSGVFLRRGQDEVIRGIEERVAAWTLLPVTNGEGLQVLRYNKDQKYEAHWDYFFDDMNNQNGGNRYATVLAYLADTEEGGETVFPNIPAPGGRNDDSFSECARYHLAAKPKKGTAILFHSMKPNGELEKKSLHTACPVIRGVKWSAAKWLHTGHYEMGDALDRALAKGAAGGDEREVHAPVLTATLPQAPTLVPGRRVCADEDELCAMWADAGECERNPTYMVGSRARPGKCVLSCDRCDVVLDTGAERQARPFSAHDAASDVNPGGRQRFNH